MIPRSDVSIEPLTDPILSGSSDDYDLFVGVIGYEERSGHLIRIHGRRLARRRVALAFTDNQVLNFDENMTCATDADIEVIEASERAIERALDTLIGTDAAQPPTRPLRALVDVSSMTRSMLARVMWWMRHSLPYGSVIDTAYSVAEFTEGLAEHGPVTESGALPHFAGWSGTPDLGLAMCVGLGFEAHLALGVVESHEPSAIWCFVPTGVDHRYDQETASLNSVLLSEIRSEHVVPYDVHDPFGLCLSLYDIASLVQAQYRLTVVPLGPKVFCLAAVAVAMTLGRRPSIWRVSAGRARTPIDRRANGDVVGLRLSLVGESTRSRKNMWSMSSAELVAQL